MRHGLLVLALVLWAGAMARDGIDRWIAATESPVLVHATSDEVRDRTGALLRAYTVEDGFWRMALSPEQVDPLFYRMLIAYEDKRFFEHGGLDPRATLRAGWQALRHGRIVSGASTLTMQVARLLEDGTTGAWAGKLRQIRLALALERRLSKQDILALYLTLAPYGGNVEGLRAAALVWLGKEPARLTPAEAAFLVALPQAPESRRPDRHPQAARAARDRVLLRMAGAGVIDTETALAAQRDPAPVARHAMPQLAPHLADRAVAESSGRHDLTLDRDVQTALEALVARHMTNRDPRLSMAVVIADHASGAILASVGSARYAGGPGQGFVDMTTALRSPGSTLKPLVYGLAFDRGLAHPETLILDAPVQFGTYAPQNFDGVFRGELPVRQALQLSLNIPVVRLTEALGPAHVVAGLKRAGVSPELGGGPPGLALSLGGLGVTLEDMVKLYAAMARGGEAVPVHWRKSEVPEASGQQVLGAAAAWQVGHILSRIPPPPAGGVAGRVAYKTGTSYGHRDAWAMGWDGRHVAGVWIGRPDGTPVPGAFGGDLAAPLLFEALGLARGGQPATLAAPPPEALLLSNAALPPNLRRFGPMAQAPGLSMAFPPDGAVLETMSDGVPVRLLGGRPPYTVMADGAVLVTGLQRSEFVVPLGGPGHTALTVIDAAGLAARVRLELR